MQLEKIIDKYKNLFGSEPLVIQSPGRINLIGEHTDHNEGFVMPAAIDKTIVIAIGKNNKDAYRMYSIDFEQWLEVNCNDISPNKIQWSNYILGVIAEFRKQGKANTGLDIVFSGDIPIGAGLSSSAALECAVAFGINELFSYDMSKMQLVKMAQNAEHEYAGVKCGIMDQFASMFGSENLAIGLDCRTLEYNYFPIQFDGYTLILCDTNVKHQLASSEYNTRRSECEKGVKIISKEEEGITSLRDVNLSMLYKHKAKIPPTIFSRCKYVIEENNRVLTASKALACNRFEEFGNLLYATHQGLMNEYEVSCKELDFLYDFARNHEGVIGARMMGGGFGGCTLNIVRNTHVDDFSKQISESYYNNMNINIDIYPVRVSNGTHQIMN